MDCGSPHRQRMSHAGSELRPGEIKREERDGNRAYTSLHELLLPASTGFFELIRAFELRATSFLSVLRAWSSCRPSRLVLLSSFAAGPPVVLVAQEFWKVRTEGLLPPAFALPTSLAWTIRIVLGSSRPRGPGPRRPHEAGRSEICLNKDQLVRSFVWVCVCVFMAPVQ